MINRIGYACINTSIKRNFKDCRLNSIYTKGIPYLKAIIVNNLELTKETLLWNINHNIFMYRATSKLVPFATHEEMLRDFNFRWYKDNDIVKLLSEIKAIVDSNNIRLSMHPDQFTVLNSPNEQVIKNSIRNLQYHKDILTSMGGSDLIIHTGGVYGDKKEAIKRFINTYNSLDKKISRFLRLENDDISYTVADVLSISKLCGIPIVLDIHHHNCNNDGEIHIANSILDIKNSWNNTKLIPKCHISTGISSYTDKRHADLISYGDYFAFCEITKDISIDLMVEAKSKEQAVLQLLPLTKCPYSRV